MANEVRNLLTIKGVCCDVVKVLDLVFDGPEYKGKIHFNNICQMPSDIVRQTPNYPERVYVDTNNLNSEIQAIVSDCLSRKNGEYFANDYELWVFENWGCDGGWVRKTIGFNQVLFETKWRACVPLIIKLSEKFPHMEFDYQYADEDFGSNAGHLILRGGKVVYEHIPENFDLACYIALEVWPGWSAIIDDFLCPSASGIVCPYDTDPELKKRYCFVAGNTIKGPQEN